MVSTAALLSRESRRDCKRGVTKWTQLSACNLHAQRQALDHTWPAKNQRTCLGSQGEDHRLKFLLGPHRKQRGRKTVLIPACVFLNLIKIHKGCKIKKTAQPWSVRIVLEGRASSRPSGSSDQQSPDLSWLLIYCSRPTRNFCF